MTHLVYVGDFSQPWHTEAHLADDLARLPDVTVERRPHPRTSDALADLERAGSDADAVVYSPTHHPHLGVLGVWRQLRARGVPTVGHHLDLWVGLRRQEMIRPGEHPFWSVETVFTPDGSDQAAEFFDARGVRHRWLPPACVSHECVPGDRRTDLAYDVVFVGHRNYPHAEWPFRRRLIDALERRYGDRFRCYDHDSGMRGLRLNDLYASAGVVVGDSLALPGRACYFSDRYFETVGRGGFLLAPNVPGILRFFVNGQHLALYPSGDLDVLLDMLDVWVAAPDRSRRAVAADGQRWVREHHTYAHRARDMLAAIGLGVAA